MEIEPLRNVGVALSEASLQQVAYDYGIKENVSDLSEATKVQLRYIQILRSSTEWQGDMAKTLMSPANALRVLQMEFTQVSRAIGNVFIPIAMKIIPVLAAVAEVIQDFADWLAKIFGYNANDYKQSSDALESTADKVTNIGDEADKTKKKLNSMLAPFDELNNVQTKSASSDSGLGADYNLPLDEYDALEHLNESLSEQIDNAKKKIQELLPVIGAVAAGFLGWKISKKLLDNIDMLNKLKPKNFSWGFSILGATNFLSDIEKIKYWIDQINSDGPNVKNVTGLLSEFAGSIGDVLSIFGQYKIGGALKIVQGIGEIASAIMDIKEDGFNSENVNIVINGLTDVAIGIGLFTDNLKLAGFSTAIQGFANAIDEIKKNWKAIKKGDWSGVDKSKLAVSAIQVIGGIGVALYTLKKQLKSKSVKDVGNKISEISDGVGSTSDGLTNMKNPLKDIAKNLAWGIVILAEIAAAAILFVGAIDVLGYELSDIAKTWQPVIDNKDTVLAALGNGSMLLLLVGGAAGGIGALTTATGATIPVAIGVGTAVLAEISLATILFTEEINSVGKGLNKISNTWQPVIDNGDTIKTALKDGSELLLAIGVATAAIGGLTIASVGLLPVAIALGTAMLKDISKSTQNFVKELSKVAKTINNKLTPQLKVLNDNSKDTKQGLKNFKTYMKDIGDIITQMSKTSAISSLSSVVSTVIGFLTGAKKSKDPITNFADNVQSVYKATMKLNGKLRLANPELETAISLNSTYFGLLSGLNSIINNKNNVSNISGTMYVNMKDAGTKLVTGFVAGMKSQRSSLTSAINDIYNSLNNSNAYTNGYWFGYSLGNGIHNGIINSVKSTIDIKNKKGKTKDYYTVRAYANGGYPESGELFYANENGMPEMVGQIGNKTAVANNDQIATTLTNVLLKAFNGSNINNNQGKTVIYIGNKKVYDGYGDYIESENDRYGTNTIRL